MIRLTPRHDLDHDERSFVMQTDEPCRIEVWTVGNELFAHVYVGTEIDAEQEPLGAYDSTVDSRAWLYDKRDAEWSGHSLTTCAHCGRSIVKEGGVWIDPEATGDDSVWRETCDAHDTFVANHEPEETGI